MSMPEDLYKEKFSGFSPEPPQGIWDGIDRRLTWRKFLSFSPKSFNIYYAAAAIGALAFLGQRYFQEADGGQDIAISSPYSPSHTPSNPVLIPSASYLYDIAKPSIVADNSMEDPDSLEAEASTAGLSEQSAYSGDTPQNVGADSHSTDSAVSAPQSIGTIGGNATQEPTARAQEAATPLEAKTKTEIAYTTQGYMAAMESRSGNGNLSYAWDLGDGSKAVGKKVKHQYKESGTYKIRLVAFHGASNISDTIYQTIHIKGNEYSLRFPNAQVASTSAAPFAPKGNVNEVSRYKMVIYSRNGKEVFSSSNPAEGWQGIYNGERLPKGVYAYRCSCEFTNGEQASYSGSITLFWEENNNLIIHP